MYCSQRSFLLSNILSNDVHVKDRRTKTLSTEHLTCEISILRDISTYLYKKMNGETMLDMDLFTCLGCIDVDTTNNSNENKSDDTSVGSGDLQKRILKSHWCLEGDTLIQTEALHASRLLSHI